MTTSDIIQVIAMFFGPMVAIYVTILYQNRKERIGAKMGLFMDLISGRDRYPIKPEFVVALNKIDVVFHRDRKVIEAWRKYYETLHIPNPNQQNIDNRLLDLLDEMAILLGVSGLKQTSLSSVYTPQHFANERQYETEFRQELLRVLRASENFGVKFPAQEDGTVLQTNQNGTALQQN